MLRLPWSLRDTLDHDLELAIELASLYLKQLLAYLGAVNSANNVHAEFGTEGIKPRITLKGFVGGDGRVD